MRTTRRGIRAWASALMVLSALSATACDATTSAKTHTAPPGTATPRTAASATSATPVPADYSAGRSTPVADDVYPQYGDTATDVLHYGLDLRWDPAKTLLTGTATLTVRAAKPTSRFVLDLAATMTVDGMTVDGRTTTPARAGDHLTVPLPGTVPADTVATVVIGYHGVPALAPPPMTRRDIPGVGAQLTDDGGVWAQSEPYGAFTWFPCNDQPSDKALYDANITAPDGWAGITGGSYLGRTEAGGAATYHWHQGAPTSTYLVAFAVDKYAEEDALGPGGLPITYWYPADESVRVANLVQKVPGMLTFLEQHYGPYPFASAGVLFVPASQVGMETQTMITLSLGLPDDALLHEFAHHWFGDAVTPKTWEGMWLNEGFAMYTQELWDAQQQNVPLDTFIQPLIAQDRRTRAVDGPAGHYNPTHFASLDVYVGPALMLNGLRHQLGDAKFYQVLTDWVQQHRYTNQDRASFTAFLNAETGRDFSAYLGTWLDSATTPNS